MILQWRAGSAWSRKTGAVTARFRSRGRPAQASPRGTKSWPPGRSMLWLTLLCLPESPGIIHRRPEPPGQRHRTRTNARSRTILSFAISQSVKAVRAAGHCRALAGAVLLAAALTLPARPEPGLAQPFDDGGRDAIALRAQQLSTLQTQIRKNGCDRSRNARIPGCRRLNAQAQAVTEELQRLQSQTSSSWPQRQPWPPNQPQPRKHRGLFGRLFDFDDTPDYTPYGQFRTRCVRLCDGYYFPLSFAANPGNFEAENAMCQSRCASPAKLFYQSNALDDDAGEMVAIDGQRYGDLPNAFRYRTELVPDCGCKPAPWTAEAAEDYRRRDVYAALDPLASSVAAGVEAVAANLGGGDAQYAGVGAGYDIYDNPMPEMRKKPKRKHRSKGGFFSSIFGR